MALATPGPSPNPNALRFQLDTTLPALLSFSSAAEAAGNAFASAVFAAGGVTNVFATNDFVTVSRAPGAAWD
ncbi:MAG: NifU N-terminal domain-containing protein, partial [Acidimicrobiales bacterium]